MIEVKKLIKKYDDFLAIDETNLIFEDGKIYGIIGTNGAGKSTFLRILSGIYRSDEGEILYDGEPIFDNVRVKQSICFIPDELYFENGANLLTMAKRYKMMYPEFDMGRFNELVADFKLDNKKLLDTFSKGMRRLSATILAIASKAKYLYFDESYDGLDPFVRKKVKDILYGEIADRNVTIAITSHSIVEMEGLCDEFLLFNGKKVVLNGDISEIKATTYKVDLVFTESVTRENFGALEILEFKDNDKMLNLIIKGDYDEISRIIEDMGPVYSKITAMSLSEIMSMAVQGVENNE